MKVQDFNGLQNFLRDKTVFAQYGLNRIGVFGSFARGENNRDIDLLIEGETDFRKMIQLKKYLEEQLETKIDIVMEKYADPIILFRARKEMKYATRH